VMASSTRVLASSSFLIILFLREWGADGEPARSIGTGASRPQAFARDSPAATAQVMLRCVNSV
jgi:hypothetical protein